MKMKTYSTAQVSRLTGVTLRQLQWWDERRIVRPEMGRNRRSYSEAEVQTIHRIAALRRAGVSLLQVRRCLKLDWKQAVPVAKPTVIGGVLVVPVKRAQI